MADVEIKLGNDGSRIDNSHIEIGDITGRDHIEHGKSDANDARALLARIEHQDRRIENLERFAFGDNRLGLSNVREEIRGLKFWIAVSTAATVIWSLYEIIRALI